LIFVTVGSLYPFDRMIRAADEAAARMAPLEFFAQVGDSTYRPQHMKFARLLDRSEFKSLTARARVIVAHAGMGSVITAMELGIPIILVPRRLDLGEHNTDHQLATARWLEDRPSVHVCLDETRLGETIEAALAQTASGQPLTRSAPDAFIERLRSHFWSAPRRSSRR
jgi:UDP-N-acetylglucosamine transferase subunit ALG13